LIRPTQILFIKLIMKQKIKVIFFGSDSFSVPVLESLEKNFEVVLIVTKTKHKLGNQNKKIKIIKCHSGFDPESIDKIKKGIIIS